MKKIISASRRTDLVAFFPEWLSSAIKKERAAVYGPSGHVFQVDLSPQAVHTFVLWSKNFSNLIMNFVSLQDELRKYPQLYLHFTITGLGGTSIEREIPPPEATLLQLDSLVKIAGEPERVSVRFDPVIFWNEGEKVKTNLMYFEKIAPELSMRGIKSIRFSFAQWYSKAKKRAARQNFSYVDPSQDEKTEGARYLVDVARSWDLNLYACSQSFLSEVTGVRPSACIDGGLLQSLHPSGEDVSKQKDRSQRSECRCTESIDIGSYTQSCPHSCLYCYANPKV